MKDVQTVRATAHAVEAVLLTAIICATVLIFVPTLGMKINAALRPIYSALGK